MVKEEPFDLSNCLTDSLSLSDNVTAPTRAISPSTVKDPYLELLNQDPMDALGIRMFEPRGEVSPDVVGTPIQEFYRGLNILITGGTGFIGKVLIQKLIRSVPHLGHVYLLIRPKRGKSCKDRFNQLFDDKVFSRMKAEVPHYQSLVTAIEGNLAESDLGLSDEDRQLLTENVNVVFHSAADVRFVEPLRAAIDSNLLGSKRVMDLSREMKNVKSYVHVSTAFSQCVRNVIKEAVPKMSVSYQQVLNYVETKTDDEIQQELSRLLQGWPNTYTFTKALCEDMIMEEAGELPICIFRPSIVGPTYQDPVRGWTDNLNGPNGLLLGAALGILHCFIMDGEGNFDVVPVDYTANCMIAAAWHTASTSPRIDDSIHVYNFVIIATKTILWKTIVEQGLQYKEYWPYNCTIWYPSFFYTRHAMLDAILHPFIHTIPGKILDIAAAALGQPQRLSKIYDKIKTLKLALKYFTTQNWIFENGNVRSLWNSLSPGDKQEFNFDLHDVDVVKHLLLGKLGVRYFYLNENMDTIPAAERKLKCLKVAHFGLKTISMLLLLKLLVSVAQVLPV